MDASASDSTTEGMVTSALLTSARVMLPWLAAVEKLSRLNDVGSADRPFWTTSSKDRTEIISTKTIGATQSRVNGSISAWKIQPCRDLPGPGRGPLAVSAASGPLGGATTSRAGAVT